MNCTNYEKEITDDLIMRAKQNDQQAISSLYELTYNSVFHTIRMMVKDEDTVYDLLQDTYLKAFGHLDQLAAPQAFKGWVRTIARNLAVDHLRKKKPQLFSSLVTEEDETLDLPDEHMESMPDAVVDYKETKRLIDEIMNSLPEDQRAVISLHYYDEISVKDIAAMLGVSENTVKSRLVYGRKKIELGVKELEKKGTKLYSLAPVPFLMFLLRTMDAQAAEIPDPNILQNVILAEGSAPAQAVGEAAVKAGIKGSASIAKKAISTKIIAAVVAVAVVGSGIAGGMYLINNHGDNEEPQTAQYEEEAPVSETEALEQAYQEILDEYRALSELDSADFEANKDAYLEKYTHPNEIMMTDYLAHYGDMYLYYIKEDINYDGTDELIVAFRVPTDTGFLPSATSYIPTDLYFFDGEKVVQGIGHEFIDYASTGFFFCDDAGTIVQYTVDPETYIESWKYLRLNDEGTALEEVESPDPDSQAYEPDWQLLAEPKK